MAHDLLIPSAGSSPQTRGARSTIPILTRCQTDHPRIRGEHGADARDEVGPVRIIPAYAGSTGKPYRKNVEKLGSSPHTRGALSYFDVTGGRYDGSSPHTRGAQL